MLHQDQPNLAQMQIIEKIKFILFSTFCMLKFSGKIIFEKIFQKLIFSRNKMFQNFDLFSSLIELCILDVEVRQ